MRINYRDADIDSGDWIKIDTIKFEHIGSRGEATKIRYPLPSRKVKATRTKKDTLYRDYNPRAIPIYMSEHIGRINKKLESGRRYKMENKALLMYSGVITLTKNDSSAISVTTSEGYGAKITTE